MTAIVFGLDKARYYFMMLHRIVVLYATLVYYKTSKYTILTNNIAALLRLKIKDFVDIGISAKHKAVKDDVVSKAREK